MIEAPGSTYMPADGKSCRQSSLNTFDDRRCDGGLQHDLGHRRARLAGWTARRVADEGRGGVALGTSDEKAAADIVGTAEVDRVRLGSDDPRPGGDGHLLDGAGDPSAERLVLAVVVRR